MACLWLGPQDPGDPGRGRWPAGGDLRRRHAPSATPTPTVRLPRRAVTGGVRARPRLHPVRGAHTVPNLPLEFTQACRKDTVLQGDVGQRVRELVRQTCEAFEIRILKGVVSKDHVHILISAPPEMAPSEIMRRIKGRTSSKLFEELPALRKRYWGQHFLGTKLRSEERRVGKECRL